MKMGGIYSITNTLNGMAYIGATNNFKRRWLEHKYSMSTCANKNPIYYDMREYGIENFKFEIIEEVKDNSILYDREIYWINKLKPYYNGNLGGLGNLGHSVSEETKQVLSIAAKNQWESKSPEEKERQIKNNLKGPSKGHLVSESTKLKLALANIGKKQSYETKKKRSESMKGRTTGNKNGNKKVLAIKDGVECVYESVLMASKQTGVCKWGIRQVTKGSAEKSKGYIFKFIK